MPRHVSGMNFVSFMKFNVVAWTCVVI
jgi:hypothetical protein